MRGYSCKQSANPLHDSLSFQAGVASGDARTTQQSKSPSTSGYASKKAEEEEEKMLRKSKKTIELKDAKAAARPRP